MPTAYNGWPAAPGWTIANGKLAALVVAGESFSPGVLAGDVHTCLQYLAQRLHNEVEPIIAPGWHQADEWGYYFKMSANSSSLISVHSAAGAIDYNATRHPNRRKGTFTAAQVAGIRRILADLEGVIYWGGDGWGSGTWDEMHFEIAKSAAEVARVAQKLRGAVTPTNPPVSGVQFGPYATGAKAGSRVLELGSAGDDVKFVQRWHGLEQDGYFGPQTEAKVKATQTRNGLTVDGVVGPATFALMGVGSAPAAPARPKLSAPPGWDIPAGQWLGHINGPAASRGGGAVLDRDNVLWWQRALIALGCVAGQFDPNSGWADARWEDATSAATRTWFARFHPGQRFTDRAYRDDWNRMIEICRSKGLL